MESAAEDALEAAVERADRAVEAARAAEKHAAHAAAHAIAYQDVAAAQAGLAGSAAQVPAEGFRPAGPLAQLQHMWSSAFATKTSK